MKPIPAQDYFAWVTPRAMNVFLALAAGAALQLAGDAIPYLTGADMTPAAIAQYRSAQSAGDPVWLPLFDLWPSFIAAPLVEESIFRGFLWRGWETSRLGARGTWLLSSLVFAAYHIPKVIGLDPLIGGIILSEDLLLGLLLGWLRWRSGSTVAGMVAHFAYNVTWPVAMLLIGAMLARP
jgi:membrane protease YdiL (CAAX protease family)